jgi:hypothetical protein
MSTPTQMDASFGMGSPATSKHDNTTSVLPVQSSSTLHVISAHKWQMFCTCFVDFEKIGVDSQ